MKKIMPFFFALILAANCFGSPLIYKATKESGELVNLDTSKYKQLRIFIKREASENSPNFYLNFYCFDEKEEIIFLSSGATYDYYSTIIDTPPDKLKIKAIGQGKYKIFIWGN